MLRLGNDELDWLECLGRDVVRAVYGLDHVFEELSECFVVHVAQLIIGLGNFEIDVAKVKTYALVGNGSEEASQEVEGHAVAWLGRTEETSLL